MCCGLDGTVLYFLSLHSIAQRRQHGQMGFPAWGTVKEDTVDSLGVSLRRKVGTSPVAELDKESTGQGKDTDLIPDVGRSHMLWNN